jgi:tetratricopeptide (TPR) repeat protein
MSSEQTPQKRGTFFSRMILWARGNRTEGAQTVPVATPKAVPAIVEDAVGDAPTAAQADLPFDRAAATQAAREAANAKDWTTALSLWSQVEAAFPGTHAAYIGRVHALRELGRFDESEKLATEASGLFPNDAQPLIQLGLIADVRQDWPTAEHFWRAALAIRRYPWWLWDKLANVLSHQCRFDEAESVLIEALAEFPEEAGLGRGYLRLAESSVNAAARTDEWAKAIALIKAVRDRFPDYATRMAQLETVATRATHELRR